MIRLLLALAACLGTGVAGGIPATARGEEIDRVVAVIRSPASPEVRVITLTRLEDETRIALVSRGGVLAATEPLDEAAQAAGLDWIVDETLLIDDATRLQVLEADAAADVGDELAQFRARFAGATDYQAFLARWNMSEDDVANVLRRMSRVKHYLDTRVSHAAQSTESEVSAWLQSHAGEGIRDRELARARLNAERMAAEMKGLVRDLRSRAEVRYLARSGSADPGREGR